MQWFIFALLSAIFLSASAIIEKKSLARIHSIDLSASLAFSNFVLALPFAFFVDFKSVDLSILGWLFLTALPAAGAFYLVAKAIRHLEISLVSPLLALSPGTTALLGFLLLGEKLVAQQIIGIALMIVGSYILTLEPEHGIFSPIKTFRESPYIHFALISLVLYSFGAVVDRKILFDLNVSVPTYMFFVHVFIALLYIPGIIAYGNRWGSVKNSFAIEKKNILFISVFTILYRFFQMQALTLMLVGIVSAIKRSSSFFTTLVGGELFHEKNLGRKIIASLVIIFGTILIVI